MHDPARMFKGKLRIVPEIAGYAIGATIGVYFLRKFLSSDAAATIARVPVAGTLVVAGPRAVVEGAFGS